MYERHMLGFGDGFMWIIWILLVVLVIWALRTAVTRGNQWPGRSNALEILEERYARGEIDRDEFEQKRKELLV